MIPFASALYGAIFLSCLTIAASHINLVAFPEHERWRTWLLALTFLGACYSLTVAIEAGAGPGTVNLYADRFSYPLLFASVWAGTRMVDALSTSRPKRLKRFHRILSLLAVAVTLGTDAVVAPVWSLRRAVPFTALTYSETAAGPLGHTVTGYMVVLSAVRLARWWRQAESEKPVVRRAVLVGTAAFLTVAILNLFVGFRGLRSAPLLPFGYLVLAIFLLRANVIQTRIVRNALRKTESRAEAILAASAHPVFVLDDEERIVFRNRAAAEALGDVDRSEERPKLPDLLRDELPLIRLLTSRAGQTGSVVTDRIELSDTSGTRRSYQCSIAPWNRGPHAESGFILSLSDVSELVAASRENQYLASHDALTGLRNRAALNESLSEMIDTMNRRRVQWAVLFMDLDGFKRINDTLGHKTGDGVLVTVAERLKATAPRADLVYRLGGDEFVMILPTVESAHTAAEVAERIAAEIRRPMPFAGRELRIDCSIGITVHPQFGSTVTEVLRNADIAMYEAKRRNETARFFDAAVHAEVASRMSLEMEISRLARSDQLLHHLQPIVDRSREVVALEALLRWNHPERGLIPPSTFIPIAEHTGVIREISRRSVINGMRAVKRIGRHLPRAFVSMDVSPILLRDPDFTSLFRSALLETGCRPDRICLEVPESALVEDPAAAAATLASLKRMGSKIAVDNFGAGLSSLGALADLPADFIKLDSRLIAEAARSTERCALFRELVRFMQAVGFRCIIDGIETEQEYAIVASLGSVWAQGALLGGPAPVDDLLASSCETGGTGTASV